MRATRRAQMEIDQVEASDTSATQQTSVAEASAAAPQAEAKARGKTDFIYGMVTDRIVALIEQGTVPWCQPWTRQQNVMSGQPYRGINQLLLGFSGRTTPFWMTFKQMVECGGKLKEEDSKSTVVVFWKFFDKRDLAGSSTTASNDPVSIVGVDDKQQQDSGGRGSRRRPPLLMYYRVFNADQIDFGDYATVPQRVRARLQESAESSKGAVGGDTVLAEMMAKCPEKPSIHHHDATQAYYSISHDFINVPPAGAFTNISRYYSTLFHELGHWTGPRLKRDMVGFSSHARGEIYSREELVAEMTAAFAANEAGILDATERQSAAYLEGWSRHLKADPKALILAAGKAQAAFDYLMGRSYGDQPQALEATEVHGAGAPF